jgi:hypothetical protein
MGDREKLVAKIEQQTVSRGSIEIVVALEDFFNGNDDLGSIGCNLGSEQPPVTEFYGVLKNVRSRPEVQDVLVRICDYSDPTSWPFSDTIYIIAHTDLATVREWVAPLLPDEVYAEWMYGKPHAAPALDSAMTPYSAWWD